MTPREAYEALCDLVESDGQTRHHDALDVISHLVHDGTEVDG